MFTREFKKNTLLLMDSNKTKVTPNDLNDNSWELLNEKEKQLLSREQQRYLIRGVMWKLIEITINSDENFDMESDRCKTRRNIK